MTFDLHFLIVGADEIMLHINGIFT